MPVLRQVPRSEVTADVVLRYYNHLFGDRDPVAEPGTSTGTPGDWWTVFALSPDILQHAVDGFAVYRNPARSIDDVQAGDLGFFFRFTNHRPVLKSVLFRRHSRGDLRCGAIFTHPYVPGYLHTTVFV